MENLDRISIINDVHNHTDSCHYTPKQASTTTNFAFRHHIIKTVSPHQFFLYGCDHMSD